jgi:hypothetical protein
LKEKYIYTLVEDDQKFISNDQVNPIKYYRQALRDEIKAPRMRFYNDRIVFEKHLPLVYKYYFKDWHYSIKQRTGTLNLAFAYFIQICTKLKQLEARDLDMLVITCLLIASKLDEIDDHLPSFEYMLKHYSRSRYRLSEISKFAKYLHINLDPQTLKYAHFQYIKLEEWWLKTLDWNLSQLTAYRFLDSLIWQGIIISTDKVILFI